jgi:hypothetical protein
MPNSLPGVEPHILDPIKPGPLTGRHVPEDLRQAKRTSTPTSAPEVKLAAE